MQRSYPPKYALEALTRLEKGGHQAYLVGGCVRDIIMNRRPKDWDICTSALPEQVTALFTHSRPTGVRHGTVTVVVHGSSMEVTTFRADGDYLDHRRPQSVSYIADLEGDLRRRDFTMNAVALSARGEYVDPLGGRADIKRGVIRCVGEPGERFGEDALRMLRALRFAAVTGFEIEAKTMDAIVKNAPLCSELAAERIAVELEKTLISDSPQRAADMISLGLLCGIDGVRAKVCDITRVAVLPKNRRVRWAGACALLMRDGVIDEVKAFLKALRLDSATISCCTAGCALAGSFPDSRAELKRLISRNGVDAVRCACAAVRVLGGKSWFSVLREVLSSGECIDSDELAIDGNDLKSLGFEGRAIGDMLGRLLDHVIDKPEDNEKALLMELARTNNIL